MQVASPVKSATNSQAECHGSNQELYESLLQFPPTEAALHRARGFLDAQLEQAEEITYDFPTNPNHLLAWVRHNSQQTAKAYGEYLQQRKSGSPRRYFTNRAHAYFFIKHVAPTKLVDGAWLYGLMPHWQDLRVRPLVTTYLEELGSGEPSLNHVGLYKRLLSSIGCSELEGLEEAHFTQGTQQLALGYLARDYFPEVLGYNLGYEQLPLHLLITTYELSELEVDPYYFQLHVTIDNASSGHAQKAARAVIEAAPVVANSTQFFRRVGRGFALNELGMSSNKVIASFDLDRELLSMLERKRSFAQSIHSDEIRFNGHTVNQWLSEPGKMGQFVSALQSNGWIRRHEDPQHSRFWRLLTGDRAAMFGVFDPYEQQLLYDWIAGTCSASPSRNYRIKHAHPITSLEAEYIDDEVAMLLLELGKSSPGQKIHRLIELMSPATHFLPAGLVATRLFNDLLH